MAGELPATRTLPGKDITHAKDRQPRTHFVTDDSRQIEGFDWAGLVARALHPIDVQIIEAMQWLDRSVSADDLARLFDEAVPWPSLSHHLRRLARLDAIELAETTTPRNIMDIAYRLPGL